MSEFETTLLIVTLVYTLLSIFYAWQIYLAPSPHQFIGVSVAVGSLIVVFGTIAGYLVLALYKVATPPDVATVAIAALLLAGIPMGIEEWIKKYREDKRNSELVSDGHDLDR